MLKNYYKKSLFWFALILFCAPATAQVDNRMVTDGREWIIKSSISGLERFHFQGDTLIESDNYKKLYRSDHSMGMRYAGAIRDEEGRVYGILPDSQTRHLLYDFSASPGDTLLLTTDKDNFTSKPFTKLYVVWKTDKVTIGANSFKRQWLYSPGYSAEQNTQTAIEKRLKPCVQGIGWKENPFLFCHYYGNMGTLLGCREGGEEIFMESDFTRSVDEIRPYAHMIERGKEWLCRQEETPWQEGFNFKYFLGNDTTIFGIPHTPLYMQRLDGEHRPEFVGGLIEVNRKVYSTTLNGFTMNQDWLLYDFARQQSAETFSDGVGTYRIPSVEQTEINGCIAARIAWNTTNGPTSDTATRGYWIEGMGSTALPMDPLGFYPGYTRRCLLACSVNGIEIYNRERDLPLHEDFSLYSPELPYHPMLKEGKTWNYRLREWGVGTVSDTYFSYVLHGDTVIAGRNCMKMCRVESGVETYTCAWYEQDHKVYRIPQGSEEFQLEYDFDRLTRYEVQPCNEAEMRYYPKYLHGVDAIETSSTYLNRLRYGIYDADNNTYCVEGVGGPLGLPRGWFEPIANEAVHFLSCYEDGKCLCTAEEMSGEAVDPSVAGIGEAGSLKQKEENRKQTVFDLAGRRVSTTDSLRPGIYICGGKKVAIK